MKKMSTKLNKKKHQRKTDKTGKFKQIKVSSLYLYLKCDYYVSQVKYPCFPPVSELPSLLYVSGTLGRDTS